MKRRSKIIATLVTLGLALSMVAIGVYSATLVSFGISGNISYKVEDVFCRINTQLYYSTDNVVLKYADAYNAGYDLSQAETLPSNIAKAPTTYFAGKEIKTYDNTTGQMITPSAEDLIISEIQLPLGSYDSTADSVKSYKYYIVIEVENYGQNDIIVQVTDTTSSENSTLLKNVQRDITNNNLVIPQNETKKVVIAVSIINLKENISSTEIDYSVLVQEKQNSLTTVVIDTIENGNTTQITTSFNSSTTVENLNIGVGFLEEFSLYATTTNLTLSNISNKATALNIDMDLSSQHTIVGLYNEHCETVTDALNVYMGLVNGGSGDAAVNGYVDLSKKDENNQLQLCLLILLYENIDSEYIKANVTFSYDYSSEISKVVYSFVNNSYEISQNYSYFESNENISLEVGDIKPYIVHADNRAYNVTKISEDAFSYTNLTNVILPDTIEIIDKSAFFECKILEQVILPEACKTIEESVFYDCIKLKNINLENVEIINEMAFSGCESLRAIDLSNVINIGDAAFQVCRGLLSINNMNNIQSLGKSVFVSCSGLTSIELPKSLTSIGEAVFSGCTDLSSIDLGNLNIIGAYAFSDCEKLVNITIPDSVTEIGFDAFDGWTAEQSIYFEGTSYPENLNTNWNYNCNAKIYLNGVLQN